MISKEEASSFGSCGKLPRCFDWMRSSWTSHIGTMGSEEGRRMSARKGSRSIVDMEELMREEDSLRMREYEEESVQRKM